MFTKCHVKESTFLQLCCT